MRQQNPLLNEGLAGALSYERDVFASAPCRELRLDRLRGHKPATLEAPPTILITFARPEESRALRKEAKMRPRTIAGVRSWDGEIAGVRVALVHHGIGAKATETTLAPVLADRPWTRVFSSGFAGGLDPALRAGDLVHEALDRRAPGKVTLLSVDRPVETVQEKARLFAETGASAVDMESDTIARLCRAAGIPGEIHRVISDPADTPLPIPFHVWFDLHRQKPKPARLLAYGVSHPGRFWAFLRFVQAIPGFSRQAAAALRLAVARACSTSSG
jgi:nucleoside phosphorylase